MSSSDDLPAELAAVGAFLDKAPLRSTVSELEIALAGCGPEQAADVAAAHGVTGEPFRSALAARDALGKLSDLIHDAAITLALPHILEPGETLVRPSLAAGNTPERLYDDRPAHRGVQARALERQRRRTPATDGQGPRAARRRRLGPHGRALRAGHAPDHLAQDEPLALLERREVEVERLSASSSAATGPS